MLDVNRLRVIDAVARHGSVTAAAKELHYSQPSVTHHLARLEAETGAQLLQRVGRGIRLTPAGQLLADRAAEIIGRIDAAGAELSAHVGLNAGRVRLAGFASANGSLVPAALATLADRYPSLEISLTDTHPLDALELLRTGKVEVAIIFRYDETEPEPPGVRLHHLLDDPVYVLSTRRERGLATLRDATWIAGCERCRSHLLSLCADAGFDPRIGYSSDDMVVMQAWVAAGLGVATQTGLALRAHHIDGVVATELPGSKRHIYAATYGEPPDPPATAALLEALAEAATSATSSAPIFGPQLTARFTSATILASSAAVSSFSAKDVGHMAPSSRFALSLKPSVAYLALNFCALWKKQTTLPPLAYAGIPYQVFGERAGALASMIAWSRSAMARSGSAISAIFSSTSRSPSALARGPRRPPSPPSRVRASRLVPRP